MKIKNAVLKDLKSCMNLQKLDKENFWRLNDLKRAVKDKDVIFLVAKEKDEIIGYILGFINLVKRDEAFLQETRVNRKERLKGIGTMLVIEFIKHAKRKKVKQIFSEIKSEHLPFYIKTCKFTKSRGSIPISFKLK